ncbi:TrmB family transcriptional regulator [Candidatus Uhrbacteria bacterium]|nr:TrmB family transcriptional regulator [Candidatus Uhrbacteria bacterium]
MYSEIFERLGLSPNEAKIYETMLSTGETSVVEISTKANIHRRNVYDSLNRLVEKGLVSPIFQKGENRYQAVHPDKLLEIVKSEERQLMAVLPQLRKIFASEPSTESAYIYKGIEGYKNYRRDLLRVADEAFFLGAKGLWRSPQIDQSFRDAYVKKFEKTIPHKVLFDPRVATLLPEALEDTKGHYRMLPKGYETPGVVDIFSDYVVTFVSVGIGNVGEQVTIFVMRNKELAESYKTWFRFIWDMCA